MNALKSAAAVAAPNPSVASDALAAQPAGATPPDAAPEQALAAALSFLDQFIQQQQQVQPAAGEAAVPQADADAPDEAAAALPPALLPTPDALLPQALAFALQQLQPAPVPQTLPGVAAPVVPSTQNAGQDLTPVGAAPATPAMTMPMPAATTKAADEATAPASDAQPDFLTQLAAVAAPVPETKSAGLAVASLHLPPAVPPQQWQSPLLQALGDRIQLQIAARSEQATIRLEPPQLGRVDIEIRQIAGAAGPLQVRLEASHAEVVHQLQQISDGLRWNLAQQRQGGEVVVQVAAGAAANPAESRWAGDARQQQQHPQQHEAQAQRPGRALDDDGTAAFALN